MFLELDLKDYQHVYAALNIARNLLMEEDPESEHGQHLASLISRLVAEAKSSIAI